MLINTTVDGVDLTMELDTGAAKSVISINDFYQLWPSSETRPTVHHTSAVLKANGCKTYCFGKD